MHWEPKKIHVTHFIDTFPLFPCSGSECTISSGSACITLQKTMTCIVFILSLLPSPLLAWWSQPPYCMLPCEEARNRVRPLTTSSWGTKALSPTAQEEMPPASSLLSDRGQCLLLSSPRLTISPCQHWDCSLWESVTAEDSQKLHLDPWHIETVKWWMLFQVTEFGSDLLSSNR